jgi:DNA-binding XRE family transcriptional regulator
VRTAEIRAAEKHKMGEEWRLARVCALLEFQADDIFK